MHTKSKIFAAARVRVLEKGLKSAADLQRLCESDYEGALRLLSDWGYGGEHSHTADFEKRIEGELKKAKALMLELSSEEALTNAILLRYDITNLKTLLKISLKEGDSFNEHVNLDMLNSLGIIEPKLMQVMVSQKLYLELPIKIAKVVASLHEREQKPSPQDISVVIDYAYYEYMRGMDNGLIKEYFKAECDFLNILALIRLSSIYKNNTENLKKALENVLMPEGEITKENLLNACDFIFSDRKKAASLLLEKASVRLTRAIKPHITEDKKLYLLEIEKDNYLIEIARKGKTDMETIAAVLGYFWARVRESEIIRLIMTLKRNDCLTSDILERLSEAYG